MWGENDRLVASMSSANLPRVVRRQRMMKRKRMVNKNKRKKEYVEKQWCFLTQKSNRASRTSGAGHSGAWALIIHFIHHKTFYTFWA